jgi:HPt (histidine-containing phosphotransfer) domain-containing protein
VREAAPVSPPTEIERVSPPVLLDEFRAGMKEAGIEHVVDAAVEAYVGETPGRMEALEAAVEAGDLRAVEIEAHGVKSGSRSIRADHFGELLEQVEAAGREKREEDIRTLFPEVKAAFEEVMEYLKSQVRSSG